MRIGLSHIIVLALLAAAAYAGARTEASRIQATCEDERAVTIINGTEYLCLSAKQLRMLQQSRPGSHV